MGKSKNNGMFRREEVIDVLRELANLWREEADMEGISILDIKLSAGYVLDDLTNMFGFDDAEREEVLGEELYKILLDE